MDRQLEENNLSYRNMESNINRLRQEQEQVLIEMKKQFQHKMGILENKSETLAAENFEYAVENVSYTPFNLIFKNDFFRRS